MLTKGHTLYQPHVESLHQKCFKMVQLQRDMSCRKRGRDGDLQRSPGQRGLRVRHLLPQGPTDAQKRRKRHFLILRPRLEGRQDLLRRTGG